MSDASFPDSISEPTVRPVWHDVIRRFHARTGDKVRLTAVTDEGSQRSARRDTWQSWLSSEELACLDTFGSEKRRREFIAGRAAARSLLTRRLACDPANVPLRIAEDGAVDVIPSPDPQSVPVHLSIAHSGPHAVAAISEQSVGVDLEEIVPRDAGLERFLMAPGQRGVISDWPYTRDEAIVLAWTLKEAVLKARRSGFRLSPKKLHLTLNETGSEDEERGEATISVEGGTTWRVLFERLRFTEDAGARSFWCAVGIEN